MAERVAVMSRNHRRTETPWEAREWRSTYQATQNALTGLGNQQEFLEPAGVSILLASYRADGTTGDNLLDVADQRLYQDKKTPKKKFQTTL